MFHARKMMVWMIKHLLIVGVIGVVCSLTSQRSEGQENAIPVNILTLVDTPEIRNILDVVEQNLRHENVGLVRGTFKALHPNNLPSLRITATDQTIHISSDTDDTRLPSPILYPDYLPHCCYTNVSVTFLQLDLTQETENSITQFITGISLYQANQCGSSISFLEQARQYVTLRNTFSTERMDAYIDFYIGNCLILEGNYPEAIEIFESGLFDGELPDSNFAVNRSPVINLSWLYIQTGQSEKALRLLETLNNDRQQWLPQRAQLYALAFQYDKAIADLDEAIQLAPDNAELYVLRAQHALLIYEWDRVLADYNMAIELAPDYAAAYYHRGLLFYTQGIREDALTDFAHYLELAPDGEFADEAAQYIDDIQTQLTLLND